MDLTLATIGAGLVAGSIHVVTGPDHLAALAPLAAHEPGRATKTGLKWGLGHGLGAGLLGLLALSLRNLPFVESLSAWSEFLVGIMLLVIGAWAFRAARRMQIHAHNHVHDDIEHRHIHVHGPGEKHPPEKSHAVAESGDAGAHKHSHAPLFVGALHGAAGTGHLLAVLPAMAMPRPQALLYLACYFVAAIASMGLFGAMLGWIGRGRSPRHLRGLMYACSLASIAIGLLWLSNGFPEA